MRYASAVHTMPSVIAAAHSPSTGGCEGHWAIAMGARTSAAPQTLPAARLVESSDSNLRLAKFAANPYSADATSPAAMPSAAPGPCAPTEPQTMAPTPAKPMRMPSTLKRVSRSPSHTNATSAPNIGVVALSSAASPAVMLSVANANNVNGTAVLMTPSTKSSAARPRMRVKPRAMARSTTPATVTRTNESGIAPKAGDATRSSGNAPPQIAPRSTSPAKSRDFNARPRLQRPP